MPVHAGQDHLHQYTRKSAIDVLAERVWNSVDAEADTVDVQVNVSSLGSSDRELFYVELRVLPLGLNGSRIGH